MKKLAFVVILFALLIALSAAQAQSVYASRTGINLATGYSERGSGYFSYSNGEILGNFPRHDPQVQSLYFPLGTTLTQADSFFAKFKFKTPTTMDGTSHGAGDYAFAQFGFFDSTKAVSIQNSLVFAIAPWTGGTGGLFCSNVYYDCYWSYPPVLVSPSTTYFVTLSYNSANGQFIVSVYDSSEQLLGSGSQTVAGTFSVDAVGVTGFSEGGVTGPLAWVANFEITAIKANSGTTEDGHIINPQSGVKFTLADNTDVTLNPQTGSKTVYIKKADGTITGQATVDFDQGTLDDINAPALTVDSSIVLGKALLGHTDSFSGSFTTVKLLAPKLSDPTYVCYHCALSGIPNPTLADVSEACTGVTHPACTTTNIAGQDYWVMDNSGGGSGPGGTAAPEFSDFAWVLAAVLGAGGFVLIRRKING